jgi:hypothetical protein
MRIGFYLFIVCMCCSFSLQGQSGSDTLRSTYIQNYPNHFFIWPVLKQRTLSFEIRDADNRRNRIFFKPNNTATLGAGFYLFEIGFELTFAVPLEERSRKIYGISDSRDLQINIIAKSWGIDAYNQKYSGFYKDDSRIRLGGSEPYPQRADIETRNYGLFGFYVLNNKRFSLRSPYNFIDRQKKSGGSMILYAALNSFEMNADSVLLAGNSLQGFGNGAEFKSLSYTTLSIGPSYSYNLVWRKFFINGTIGIGPAHHWVYYRDGDNAHRYDISINSTYSLRFAAGYNSDRFFGGVGFAMQSRVVRFEDVIVENASQTVRFMIGYRFKECGILKKKAWELIPEF